MDAAKHTPGPWFFEEWNAGVNTNPGYGLIVENGRLNVTVHTRQPSGPFNDTDCTEQAKANARLIAAAPELLDALKAALKALDAIGNEMTVGERYTNAGQYLLDALPNTRAAIDKAEGGAK